MISKAYFSLILLLLCLDSSALVMSKRCELMHTERKKMILLKSKAISLGQKAQSLVQRIPKNKKQAYAKMKLVKVRLDRKTADINEALKQKEETMIRKGCPGLKYRSSL